MPFGIYASETTLMLLAGALTARKRYGKYLSSARSLIMLTRCHGWGLDKADEAFAITIDGGVDPVTDGDLWAIVWKPCVDITLCLVVGRSVSVSVSGGCVGRKGSEDRRVK